MSRITHIDRSHRQGRGDSMSADLTIKGAWTVNETTLNIPALTLDSIHNYVEHRLPPGGFLMAVLTNNLRAAVAFADEYNQAALADIVKHLTWEVPSVCWGSHAKVAAWLNGDAS